MLNNDVLTLNVKTYKFDDNLPIDGQHRDRLQTSYTSLRNDWDIRHKFYRIRASCLLSLIHFLFVSVLINVVQEDIVISICR